MQLTLALMQSNPIVGDINGNTKKLLDNYGSNLNADILITSECFLTGYPIEDLVLRSEFMDKVEEQVEIIRQATIGKKTAILVGLPIRRQGEDVYNGALFIHNGTIQEIYKHHRPNYGPFDEKRIFKFAPLNQQKLINFNNIKIGVMICEDIWYHDVAAFLKEKGADIFLTLHGSPFYESKYKERAEIAWKIVKANNTPLVYVNQVGGQDELIFDGGSFVMQPNEDTCNTIWLNHFKEETQIIELDLSDASYLIRKNKNKYPDYAPIEEVRKALVLSVCDYVNKNNFPGVIIGLSGGIDSALTAALAVDALGADRVRGILMPGPHSSQHSIDDAVALAKNLKINYLLVPIIEFYNAWKTATSSFVNHNIETVTHENSQARARGVLLMTYSNETGYMVLTTGNKSEMSVGYATLYGDMNGGFNALKDLYKTKVFELAKHYNKANEIIPWNTITKPPSAELAKNQVDQNSLPPYDVLDSILTGLIEKESKIADIANELNVEENLVRKIQNMLYSAEFKRRQACPGPKITRRSLGKDRRYPIVNRYRDR